MIHRIRKEDFESSGLYEQIGKDLHIIIPSKFELREKVEDLWEGHTMIPPFPFVEGEEVTVKIFKMTYYRASLAQSRNFIKSLNGYLGGPWVLALGLLSFKEHLLKKENLLKKKYLISVDEKSRLQKDGIGHRVPVLNILNSGTCVPHFIYLKEKYEIMEQILIVVVPR